MPQGQIPRGERGCAWRRFVTLPALGTSSLCLSQIADLPMPAGLPCNSILSLAGIVPPDPLQGQMPMVGCEEEKLCLSPSGLAGTLWDAHMAGLGSCSVGLGAPFFAVHVLVAFMADVNLEVLFITQ